MSQSTLKTFAQDARNKLRQLIGARLDYVLTADTAELRQQATQVSELRNALKNEGRDPLIERVAYTWFNRLAALRFMDANGYHPFGARVITPATANETLPELLQQARAGALDADLKSQIANLKTFDDLLAGRIPVDHPEAQVFKLLLVATCNYYHRLMPFLFEKIGDATELLLPEDLLTEHSIVADFRQNLTDDDCWNEEVLGWFYQYYISEKKDEVMARNAAVPKQDIPAVTQLFTPHWIVRYLVENSLGRLWLLNRPHSKLREKMPYYIEGEAENDFLKITKPEDIRLLDPAGGSGHMLTYAFDLLYAIYEEEGYDAPEIPGLILRHNLYGVDICDRAVALAAFALCMKARARDSRFFRRAVQPHLISLQEVNIEEASLQSYVAYLKLDTFFAQKSHEWIEAGSLLERRQFFNSQKLAEILLRLIESRGDLLSRLVEFGLEKKLEVAFFEFFKVGHKLDDLANSEIQKLADAAFRALVESKEILNFDSKLALGDLAKQVYLHFMGQFAEAKNFGALIQPCLTEQEIQSVRKELETRNSDLETRDLTIALTHAKILHVLEQAEFLCQRYHVVVANPPYMGNGAMNAALKKFVGEVYSIGSGDCATCFALRNLEFTLSGGRIGMITFQNWMFVSSFSEFREHLLSVGTVSSFVHNGRGVWGPDFGSCAFCLIARPTCDSAGVFVRLFDKSSLVQTNEQLVSKFLNRDKSRVFVRTSASFRRVPGVPLAYWISDALAGTFARFPAISTVGVARTGLSSGEKPLFCREWTEVSLSRIKFGARDNREFTDASERPGTWAPLVTGGPFRKWYGNFEEVILWRDDGKKVREFEGSTIRNPSYYFRSGITWSDVTISTISFRFVPVGFIICDVGPMAFFEGEDILLKALAWGNTLYTERVSKALNPTVHFKTGDFHRIPVTFPAGLDRALADECVRIARADWDNFETSWDFHDLPLLRPGLKGPTLAASWQNWKAQCDAGIRRMQELETENNRLFIAAYGLQDELNHEVPEDQITLARADARKDMAAFLSYAVGCMMGRYSLDQPGLILADAGATVRDYLVRIRQPTFASDADGILPVLDAEWFQDDIVDRFREFLRVTYGNDKLPENLAFIEASLGKLDAKTGKVKPTDLRTYFVRDFYKNHLSNERAFGYKKRPIYWMFSSPEGSFQALVYLHRYTRDTVNLLLNDYVREFISKLEEKRRQLTGVTLNESARPGDRTKAAKELGKIDKMLKELRAWERDVLLPLAQQRIELDLDDGVKVNYLKFKGAVVNIPGLDKGEEE